MVGFRECAQVWRLKICQAEVNMAALNVTCGAHHTDRCIKAWGIADFDRY